MLDFDTASELIVSFFLDVLWTFICSLSLFFILYFFNGFLNFYFLNVFLGYSFLFVLVPWAVFWLLVFYVMALSTVFHFLQKRPCFKKYHLRVILYFSFLPVLSLLGYVGCSGGGCWP